MNDATFTAYNEKYEAAQRLEAEIFPRNKAVLFDALSAADIASVVVEFEGSGDSGQMKQPCARLADETVVDLPDVTVELERVDWSAGIQKETLNLTAAVETMAWKLLEDSHDGWENGDGGYGEFAFDVSDRSITLEYNERYTETNYHEHEF